MIINKIARLEDHSPHAHKPPIGQVRKRIVRVSVFLAGWELLKSEVEHGVREHFLKGCDHSRLDRFEAYQRQVLYKHKSLFEASLRWLAQTGALSEADVICIRELRAYRREVASSLPNFLMDSSYVLDIKRVAELKDLLTRLTMFWSDFPRTANDNSEHTCDPRVVTLIDELVDT